MKTFLTKGYKTNYITHPQISLVQNLCSDSNLDPYLPWYLLQGQLIWPRNSCLLFCFVLPKHGEFVSSTKRDLLILGGSGSYVLLYDHPV